MMFRSLTMIAAIVLFALVPAALAQVGQQRLGSAQAVSDAELKSFAGIVIEVQRIGDSYHAKREAAQTVREQQQVELAASDELTRAVTQEGMTVERYQEILKETLSNPDLSAKVKLQIKDSQK